MLYISLVVRIHGPSGIMWSSVHSLS